MFVKINPDIVYKLQAIRVPIPLAKAVLFNVFPRAPAITPGIIISCHTGNKLIIDAKTNEIVMPIIKSPFLDVTCFYSPGGFNIIIDSIIFDGNVAGVCCM